MTGPSDHEAGPRPLAPLDYARPEGTGVRLPPAVQMTLGVILALAVIMPLAVFGPFIAGAFGVIAGPLVGIVIVGSIAYVFRRYETRRAWAAGIWIGVGIAVLVDGICWMAISRMRF